MKVHIRYFASVREQLGPGEAVTLTGSAAGGEGLVPRTVGELRAWLIGRSPEHAAALDLGRGLRTAFNQTLCGPEQPLADGSEVAFFPPVTGG